MPTPALGIDFGTSTTIAVLRRADGTTRPLLFDGTPLLPSAVYLETDGRPLTGRDAVHAARREPSRYEPSPKRRLNDGAVLLGDREVPVVNLAAAVLRRVAVEATRVNGAPVGEVTLTHPAEWGASRRELLTEAARQAGLPRPRLVPEPVAAAHYFTEVLGHRIPVGSAVVVYDFGAGTFDASVVIRGTKGFEAAVVSGREVGGLDIDAAIVDWLGSRYGQADPAAWQRLTAPTDTAERRARELLWADVRTCKEQLSRSSSATLAIPLLEVEAHLTRDELERLAAPVVEETVRTTAAAIRHARVGNDKIVALFPVGGSSRLPLAGSTLHRRLGLAPTTIEQPEVVVGEGSLRVPTAEQGGSHTRILPVVPSPTSPAPAGATPAPVPVPTNPHAAPWPAAPDSHGPASGYPHNAAPHGAAPAHPQNAAPAHPQNAAPAHQQSVAAGYPQGTATAQPHRASQHGAVPTDSRAAVPAHPRGGTAADVASADQRRTVPAETRAAGAADRRATNPRGPAGTRNAGGGASAVEGSRGADADRATPVRSGPVYGASSGARPRKPSGTKRSGRRAGRAVLLAGVAMVLAVVLVGGGWYGYQHLRDADQSTSDGGTSEGDTSTADRPSFVPASWSVAVASTGGPQGWGDNTSSDQTGTCTLTDGQLSVTKTRSSTGMFSCGGAQTKYTNVAVQTTVSVAAGCGGIWLRTGDAEGYFLSVCGGAATLYVLGRTGDPSADNQREQFTLPDTGADVTIGVRAIGAEISVYDDDTSIGAVHDDQISAGRVDLGVFADGSTATATFRDTRVWRP
ncbi:MAG TPA: Hsp70 family protein [Actinocatenispora sp.]